MAITNQDVVEEKCIRMACHLVLIAASMEELIENFESWKEGQDQGTLDKYEEKNNGDDLGQ